MVHDFQESWGNALASVDEAVRTLALISRYPEGRQFLNNLERGEAGLCVELLDRVRGFLGLSHAFTLLKLRHRGWRNTRLTNPRGNRS